MQSLQHEGRLGALVSGIITLHVSAPPAASPLVYEDGENMETLGLTGEEVLSINAIAGLVPKKVLELSAWLDAPNDVEGYEKRRDLQSVLRRILNG
jgi:hypothetical protein